MKNYIYTTGTLTITCFVHPDYTENGKRYHGTTKVATRKDVLLSEIQEVLNEEIEKYLKKCKFKNCERSFSYTFKTY